MGRGNGGGNGGGAGGQDDLTGAGAPSVDCCITTDGITGAFAGNTGGVGGSGSGGHVIAQADIRPTLTMGGSGDSLMASLTWRWQRVRLAALVLACR